MFDLGEGSTLVLNGFTDVTANVTALGLQAWPMITTVNLAWMRQLWAAPQPFIDAALAAAAGRGFAGYDLDFEPDDAPNATGAAAFAGFLSTFADAMAAHGLRAHVDVATWSGVWNYSDLGRTSPHLLLGDMGTYTGNLTAWTRQLDEAVAALPLGRLCVGLETDLIVTPAQLAPRLAALQARGIRSVCVWQLPLPDDYWPFLAAL